MDLRESPTAPTLSPASEAAVVAAGPALGRALERYALRDLKERKREEYHQQNVADSALVDQLRHKRNENVERIDQESWNLRVTRGLAMAAQREPWINAHERTVQTKRATKEALASTRATHNPSDRAQLEQMRVAHQSAQDSFAAEQHELNLTRESAICNLRERWNDARGRTTQAKRAVTAVRNAHADQHSKERDARVLAQAQTYSELRTASQVAWEAVRKASLEHARAAAETAWLEQNAADDAALEAARAHETQLSAALAACEQAAQEADRAVADAYAVAAHSSDADGSLEEARLQAALVEARDEEDTEKLRAQRAVKAYKNRTRAQEQAAFDDLRKRRNAESESYAERVRAVYAARGDREASVRSEYLDRRAEEWDARRRAQADTKAYARSQQPAHAAALEDLRVKKNTEQARFSAAVRAIDKRRELSRNDDRNEVLARVDEVLRAYQNPADERETRMCEDTHGVDEG